MLFRIVGNASGVMVAGNRDAKIIEGAKKEGQLV
jgi:hypothetical protein